MRSRLFAAAKYVLYPLFYLFCLSACLYLTFPWDKLKDRIESEFARSQAKKGAHAWRLEIDTLSGYWLSGIEIQGAKIIMPPDDEEDDKSGRAAPKGALSKVTTAAAAKRKADAAAAEAEAEEEPDGKKSGKDDDKEDKKTPPKDSVVLITEAHARVRLLPLLIGKVRLDFSTSVFDGEIKGMIPFGGGDLSIEVENVNLAQVAPLKDIISVPIKGIANGKLELSAPDGKWNKANGSFNLTVKDMVLGDGKSKFRKLVTLTPATVGAFELSAKADQGVFKIEKFGATGQEVELAGEGTSKLKEPWDNSILDLWLRFGFSDEYKNKDDRTKALLVDEGPFPALIYSDKKLKKALRQDGLWGFNIKGKLARLSYIPTKADGPRGKTGDASSTTSTKKKNKDDDEEDTGSTGPTAQAPPTAPTYRRPGAANLAKSPRNPTTMPTAAPDAPAPTGDAAPEPPPGDADPGAPPPDGPEPEGQAPPPDQGEPPPEEQPAPR